VLDRLISAAACRSVTAQPAALLTVLNLLDEGILLLDDHCNTLWANTVFASAIRADLECDRILTEARRLATTVTSAAESFATTSTAAPVVARADVRTRVASYSLRATRLVYACAFEQRPFDVVVAMARTGRRVLDGRALMHRFSLTPAETDVALLIARGMSNREIARELAISAHTARHHTESVLLKLGIHTRAAVAGVVLDGPFPASRNRTVTRPRGTNHGAGTARRDGYCYPYNAADRARPRVSRPTSD
jgi:DNA-binding CsgD family transcriptional regulator